MRSSLRLLGSAAALVGARAAGAQTTSQTVTYEVQAIKQIAISGSAPTLTVSAAAAGAAPTSVSSSGLTYAITVNETARKITASLSSNMPAGVTLAISLAAPTGATSAGAVSLSTVAADAVTGINALNQSGLSLVYTLSATAAAGVVPQATRTVTLTIL